MKRVHFSFNTKNMKKIYITHTVIELLSQNYEVSEIVKMTYTLLLLLLLNYIFILLLFNKIMIQVEKNTTCFNRKSIHF